MASPVAMHSLSSHSSEMLEERAAPWLSSGIKNTVPDAVHHRGRALDRRSQSSSDYGGSTHGVDATLRAELAVYKNEKLLEKCQTSALESQIISLEKENDNLRRITKYQEIESYMKDLPESLQTIEKETNILRNLAAAEVSTMKNRAHRECQRMMEEARSRAASTRAAANASAEALVEKLEAANSASAATECEKAVVELAKCKRELVVVQAELKKTKTALTAQRKHDEKLQAALADVEQRAAQAKVACTTRLRATPRSVATGSPVMKNAAVSCSMGPRNHVLLRQGSSQEARQTGESDHNANAQKTENMTFEAVKLRQEVRHYELELQNELDRQDDSVKKAVADALQKQESVHQKTVSTLHSQVYVCEEGNRVLRKRTAQLEEQQTAAEHQRQRDAAREHRMKEEERERQMVLREKLKAQVTTHDKLQSRLCEESGEVKALRDELDVVKALNNELATGIYNLEELGATQREHEKDERQRHIDEVTASLTAQLEQQERAHTSKIDRLRKNLKRASAESVRKAESAAREALVEVQSELKHEAQLRVTEQATTKSLRTQLKARAGNEYVLRNLLEEHATAQVEREKTASRAHRLKLCQTEERLQAELQASLRECEVKCEQRGTESIALATKLAKITKDNGELYEEHDALRTTVADMRDKYEALKKEHTRATEEAEAAALASPKQCVDCEKLRSLATYWEKCANMRMRDDRQIDSADKNISTKPRRNSAPCLTKNARASTDQHGERTTKSTRRTSNRHSENLPKSARASIGLPSENITISTCGASNRYSENVSKSARASSDLPSEHATKSTQASRDRHGQNISSNRPSSSGSTGADRSPGDAQLWLAQRHVQERRGTPRRHVSAQSTRTSHARTMQNAGLRNSLKAARLSLDGTSTARATLVAWK